MVETQPIKIHPDLQVINIHFISNNYQLAISISLPRRLECAVPAWFICTRQSQISVDAAIANLKVIVFLPGVDGP